MLVKKFSLYVWSGKDVCFFHRCTSFGLCIGHNIFIKGGGAKGTRWVGQEDHADWKAGQVSQQWHPHGSGSQ